MSLKVLETVLSHLKPNNFSWKSRWEGGSCASGNPGERGGLKNYPICQGGVGFFWNNPVLTKLKCRGSESDHVVHE